MNLTRRDFLHAAGGAIALGGLAATGLSAAPALPPASAASLPRWRGFNLLEKFVKWKPDSPNPAFVETDFEWMAEWGFNFARLPMSYLCWSDASNWRNFREPELKDIDEVVKLGKKHGVHINLNFHRAPGYCVNPPKEPLDLWKDAEALEACSHHWAHFAKRFKGVPNSELSFDLLNEPADIPAETYIRVVTQLVSAIRAEDPNRLIIADGLRWGRDPVPGLAGLGIGQSTRGYDPMRISHFKANWVKTGPDTPEPTWPLEQKDKPPYDKERLRKERIAPWLALARQGVGVHVGEWGCYQYTPHAVALKWMRDCLSLWKEVGWGWSMWSFRGSFGILDSNRTDVAYESFRGHKLDRQMLELLREF